MAVVIVNTHQAKTRLSELIRQAEAGEEVILARNGKMVAKLIPWPPARPVRTPGLWAGQVTYGDDIVGSDEDITAMFDASAELDEP